MSDVLITYGWVRSSYAALRNLKKHNINVAIADDSIFGMSQFSRLKDCHDTYTSHYVNEERFIKDIKNIYNKRDIRFILPSHNETEIIARHKKDFPKSVCSMIPDADHCRLFNNKSEAYNLAKSLDIPVPKRFLYEDPLQIESIISDSRVERVVIKLLTGNSGKGVFYEDSPKKAQEKVLEIIKKYNLSKSRYPQIEEYVHGDGYGCSVLFWKGEQITHFTHKRLREKIKTGGTSTYRESASHKGIEDAAKKLFSKIGWHGLAMSEFKVCDKTNRFWFIEVNPRMWGSMPLAISAGVEFPYLTYLCATHGPEEARKYHSKQIVKKGWGGKWLLGEYFVLINNLISLNFKDILKMIFERKSNSIDDFYWDDPFAFLGQVISYIKKALLKRSLNASDKGMIR